MITHGALFNGIAGFPLAASWAGIPTTWTVEIDEFCNKVSKKHFPDAIQYTDIRTATHLPYVDIISGGFPCQPYSVAGKQLGNEDDRALWPEMLRVIREVGPSYVIGENVPGLISMALDQVLADLEALDYTCETFVIPACALNAPHRRERVWILAYSNGIRNAGRIKRRSEQIEASNEFESGSTSFAYSNGSKRETEWQVGRVGWQRSETEDEANDEAGATFWTTQSPLCGRDDGVSNRLDRLKSLGNAIVPQVAYEIFKAILQHATL